MNLLTVFLQASSGGGIGNILLIVGMVVVFYFFMIRPQQKRQKEIKKFQEAIQPGTEVVTSGGIYGKVKDIKDKYLIVEIAENIRIKVEKTACFAANTESSAK